MTQKFMGIDSSTQSLSVTIIEQIDQGDKCFSKIIYECSLNFNEHFSHYGIKDGVLPDTAGTGEALSPPQMWVEALEAAFHKMKDDGVDLSSVQCIGTAGQQHGSVYLNSTASEALGGLSPTASLVEQLKGIYARANSPIWMDSSTSVECAEITEALGGPKAVCALTGSECFERFTGPQIRKFYKNDVSAYTKTFDICLVSSFIPSILSGKILPIDSGDGAGMNLMDITKKEWSYDALEATAPGLSSKLLPITASHSIAGTVSPFFSKKFGLHPDCKIIPGTGDNPSSLVGLGLVKTGVLGISLGTSDTLFAFLPQPVVDPTGQSHVYGSPTGHYMALLCFKNGSLAREAVKNQFALSWDNFSSCLSKAVPGNKSCIMLPFFDTEIVPRVLKAGVKKYGIDDSDAAQNVQAVIEAQMTSMAMHSEWMGLTPKQIYVTGGASANKQILQVMANVFNAEVLSQETTNASGLGSAVRAQHAVLKAAGQDVSFDELVSGYINTSEENITRPQAEAVAALKAFREIYRVKEREYLAGIQ